MLFAVILALFLASCGPPKSFQTYDQIELEVPAIELPAAAIDPISMSVGIYYDRWFIDHRLSVFVRSTGVTPYEVKRYVLDIGKPSVQLVDQAATAVFSDVETIDEVQWLGGATKLSPDALVRPYITNVELDGANEVEYLFRLYTPQGEIIEEIHASGRSLGHAPGEGLAEAMRVAAAQLMVKLARSEKLRNWLNASRTADQPLTHEDR